ncbi:MAG: hypothetical protein AB7S38_00525 [Vulcanimicrobiota bacterium]
MKKVFSPVWLVLSLVVFVAIQLVFGALAGKFLLGGHTAQHTRFLIEGLVVLISYFVGAFLIGVVSPDVRLVEPVAAAFLATLAVMSVALMVPSWFLVASLGRLIACSLIACGTALVGVLTGELVSNR